MFTFNVGGFGWDDTGAEIALGVITSSTFEESPKCLFGLAISTKGEISLDLFWIPIL